MTREDAIKQLSQSGRGISAMRHILAWMDDSGLGLDARNKVAAIQLIESTWEQPSTRDLIAEVTGA